MKKGLKKMILSILFKLKILGRVSLGIRIMNFIFQRVFMINARFKSPVHFTTKVNVADKIHFHFDDNTLASFATSGCCYIQAYNTIYLGKNILFAKGVNLISANHNTKKLDSWKEEEPITIGDNVWIGVNAIILPGVKIGHNCIIAAGAVVTKSFNEDNLVIAGNPAKIINRTNI